MKRRPRTEENKERCDMKTLTACILFVMIIQLCVMLVPLSAGGYIYIQNRETINAFGNISASRIVSDINEFPLANIGKTSKDAMLDAKQAVHKALFLISRMKEITGEIKNGTNIFDDIKKVLDKSIAPLDELKEMLSPRMRGTLLKILDKVFKILDKMGEDEIHRLLENTNNLLNHDNVNRTMHVVNDADATLDKMDKILSKFVK